MCGKSSHVCCLWSPSGFGTLAARPSENAISEAVGMLLDVCTVFEPTCKHERHASNSDGQGIELNCKASAGKRVDQEN